MSFAMTGLTHCEKCYKSLNMNEYGLCKYCKKEEEENNKKKVKVVSKVYKGYELIKAIADGEIKEGSKFIFKNCEEVETVYWNGENFKYQNTKGNIMVDYADIELINGTFELIEDERDIDNIEELKNRSDDYFAMLSDKAKTQWLNKYQQEDKAKINELVQAVKQLNKEIKSIKEK